MADGAKTVNGFGLASRGTGIKGAPVDIATGERPQDRLRIPTPQPAKPPAVTDVARSVLDPMRADQRCGSLS